MKIGKIVLAAVFAVNAAAQEPRPASIEGIVVKLGSGEPLEGDGAVEPSDRARTVARNRRCSTASAGRESAVREDRTSWEVCFSKCDSRQIPAHRDASGRLCTSRVRPAHTNGTGNSIRDRVRPKDDGHPTRDVSNRVDFRPYLRSRRRAIGESAS
jgi:hypothetical protein